MRILRKIRESDIKRVIEITSAVGVSVWNEEDLLNLIENRDAVHSLVETEGQVSGFIYGRVLTGNYCEGQNRGEIFNMAVEPNVHRKGLGTFLLLEIVEQFKSKNVSEIWLEVRKGNESAIMFYERFRFQEVGIRKGYYKKPYEDALLMSRMC